MEGTPDSQASFDERGEIRNEREAVDAIIAAQFENREKLSENAQAFFALEDPECNMPLTDQEITRFGIFASHAIKKIIRGQSRKYDGKFENSHVQIPDLSGNDPYLIAVLLHDVSHSAGLVLSGKVHGTADSLVPMFFRYEIEDDFNKRELMEEELWAYIFYRAGSGEAFENVTLRMLASASSFDDFLSSFVGRCMKNIERDNHALMYKGDLTYEEYSSRYDAQKDGVELIQSIINDPPHAFIDTMRQIWEKKDSPRVLADLFSEKAGPYISALQQRKIYSRHDKFND